MASDNLNININTSKKTEPPLVDVKVSNPIIYLKKWWQKVIGNEGVDIRFKIHPLTAIAVAVIVASIGFGVGRFVLPFSIPFFKFNGSEATPSPSPVSDIWKSTAFIGTLQFSSTTEKFFLVTTASEAITLDVTLSLDLTDFVGRRILAVGEYNKQTRVLKVADAKDMEVLPKNPVSIPTVTPTPTPAPTPTPIPSEIIPY